MTRERAMELVRETFASLRRSGILERDIVAGEGTVLLGRGSELDSIAFVTFVTDLEERVRRETGKEFFLTLDELASTADSLDVRVGSVIGRVVAAG